MTFLGRMATVLFAVVIVAVPIVILRQFIHKVDEDWGRDRSRAVDQTSTFAEVFTTETTNFQPLIITTTVVDGNNEIFQNTTPLAPEIVTTNESVESKILEKVLSTTTQQPITTTLKLEDDVHINLITDKVIESITSAPEEEEKEVTNSHGSIIDANLVAFTTPGNDYDNTNVATTATSETGDNSQPSPADLDGPPESSTNQTNVTLLITEIAHSTENSLVTSGITAVPILPNLKDPACNFFDNSTDFSACTGPVLIDAVNALIQPGKIMLFTKSECGYSLRAKKLIKVYMGTKLIDSEFEFLDIDYLPVEVMDEIQDYFEESTGAYTVPRVFVGEKCVGGYDDLKDLHEGKKLMRMVCKEIYGSCLKRKRTIKAMT